MKRCRLVVASVLSFCLLLSGLAPSAHALFDQQDPYNAFVLDIAEQLQQRESDFVVPYNSNGLNQTLATRAMEDAIALSLQTLFHMTHYTSYTQNAGLRVQAGYQPQTEHGIYFAASWDDVEAILQRSVMEHELGVHIYIKQEGSSTAHVQQQAYNIIQNLFDDPTDDAQGYLVTSVDGYTVQTVEPGGYFITYIPSYSQSAQESALVRDYAQDLVDSVNTGALSEREKVLQADEWVRELATYTPTGDARELSPYYMIRTGEGVCQAYALLTHEILLEMDLVTRIVTGTTEDLLTGEMGLHMWNAVLIDGEWLHLDTTWNDTGPDPEAYTLITEEEMAQDHFFDKQQYGQQGLSDATDELLDKEAAYVSMVLYEPQMSIGGQASLVDPSNPAVSPILHEGRTMIPLRAVIEGLGGRLSWDETERKVTVLYRSTRLELWIDNPVAEVNGIEQLMEVPPMLDEGRTLLPVRFVCEMLGMSVDWEADSQRITIQAA